MLTDDEARSLLQHAAGTVDVDPAGQITTTRPRPRWPLLAAAAAVLVVAGVAAVLARPDVTTSPAGPPAPAEVQVPSVLGYDQASATRTLEQAGLDVRTVPVTSCESDRSLGTDPAAGSFVVLGSQVTLRVADGNMGYCIVDQIGWQLLAFADGRGKLPAVASALRISEGTSSSEITAEQAADPETWRPCGSTEVCTSVLVELREAALGFHPDPDNPTYYLSPTLSTSPSLVDGHFALGCQYDGPGRGADFARVGVMIGQNSCPATVLDVYRSQGEITEVVLRRLLVREDSPSSIGTQFRAFARGDAGPPPVADQVDLYLGNAFTGVVTRRQADTRDAWATCSEVGSYAGRTCPLSPLDVLRQHPRVDDTDRPRGLCMPTYGPVPPDLRKLDVTVLVPKPDSIELCMDNFAIQLFTNDAGELVAVSTLLGEP